MAAWRVVRGQDPVRRRLWREVRQQVTKQASCTKFLIVPAYNGGLDRTGPATALPEPITSKGTIVKKSEIAS